MSEYIVDVGNADEEYIGHFGYMVTAYADNPIREKIIRCRDCKRFMPQGTHRWKDGTTNKDSCSVVRGFVVQITPYGFCAWGERREQ